MTRCLVANEKGPICWMVPVARETLAGLDHEILACPIYYTDEPRQFWPHLAKGFKVYECSEVKTEDAELA